MSSVERSAEQMESQEMRVVTPQEEFTSEEPKTDITLNGGEPQQKLDVLGKDSGKIRSFAQLSSYFPNDYETNAEYNHLRKFVLTYAAAQIRIAEGKETRGKRILKGLRNKVGFAEFADANQPLLAAIDVSVRGVNTQRDEAYDEVKPAFKIKVPKSNK